MKLIDNILRKQRVRIKAWRTALSNSLIYFFFYHVKLREKHVFLESRSGSDFTGNILRICEELSKEEYKEFKLYVWVRDKSKWPAINELCKNYGIKIKLIHKELFALCVMESSKFIVSDSGAPAKYVKRDGQIVLDTWHGTPLKVMGRKVRDERKYHGSLQHYFLSCDYRLFPNDFMKEVMMQDYMVGEIQTAKVLMSGYPRNSVFFDQARREEMRKYFGFENKKIYAYMPTHRGNMSNVKNANQMDDILPMLSYVDERLNDDQIFLVKLHVFNQMKIDFSIYKHIIPFPVGYETYDVLNTVDCLITDYSSVFFDYANSRGKIILFAYDEEQYFEDRGGTYFPLSDMPFPIVRNVEALWTEMNREKEYDDTDFLAKFCTYDSIDAVQKLCRHVFRQEHACREEEYEKNGKENVLIFSGTLAQNGITSALVSALKAIDKEQKNYFVAFRRVDVNTHPERIDLIPDGVSYMPLYTGSMLTVAEKLAYHKLKKHGCSEMEIPRRLLRAFQRENDRFYYHAGFSKVLQFDGYGIDINLLYSMFRVPRAIWVHSDMEREIVEKGIQNRSLLHYAYNTFDQVVVVNASLIEPTLSISGKRDNIVVVNNIFDAERVRAQAKKEIDFQKDTLVQTWNPKGIEGVLESKGIKFITIGRFSLEKAHDRLIDAFDRFCDTHPDSQMVIIGGYGGLYDRTIQHTKEKRHWKNITLIRSISNPMPIVKRCDCFILPSLYEGLPVVIFEADCLGIPVFATDIPATREFMQPRKGVVADNSEDGIYWGMQEYAAGRVHTMELDYDEWYEKAVTEFENVLSDVG